MSSKQVDRPQARVAFDNSDRVVLVTGAGQGIGREVARAFVESGAQVVGMDINAGLEERFPPGGHFQLADVSKPEDCQRVVDWAVESFGGLDVLIPNAVIEGPESYQQPHEFTPEHWEKYFAVNVGGMQNIGRAAIPYMLEQRSGHIVIIASVQSHAAAPESSMYGATKAADLNMAKSWGAAYARSGLRVNAVLPGAVWTEGMEPKLEGQGGMQDLANRHPRGCLALPEEVAQVVLALASPIAANVVGAGWSCDGGLSAFPPFAPPYQPRSMPEQPRPRWKRQ